MATEEYKKTVKALLESNEIVINSSSMTKIEFSLLENLDDYVYVYRDKISYTGYLHLENEEKFYIRWSLGSHRLIEFNLEDVSEIINFNHIILRSLDKAEDKIALLKISVPNLADYQIIEVKK